ncbi:putative DNA polymerase III, delta subunit [Richelia sinica FACHB-800]|uniref:DNA polymerase III subunit delta n=1 Tax=Richelia sinica FACHB-800 TaxID=1357546 RepID=A0A975Y7C6_9NOST|nr:DNA polymerase III subunit delta [Richelia sinica]MBD2666923.1 DNA polymerase III subunit delta [Richelia sinica FACHB-800]QXE26191.1 putative DNA polymerase III, delta subunit [Richelia sinica FACHB-800]
MIVLLTGDDEYAIQSQLNQYKAEIDFQWLTLCYHRFSDNQLDKALSVARTRSLTDGKKLVIVENCHLKQWGDTELETLQQLVQVPDSTILVFVANSVDKRLKVYKHLVKYGKLLEFSLIPPWRDDLIEEAIVSLAARLYTNTTDNAVTAKKIKLLLSEEAVTYLAQAIGNDMTRAASELRKLSIYAQGRKLELGEVQELVPCQTQNSLQLAAAMREGKSHQVLQLLDDLLSRSQPLMVIVSTILTQFRTWLWVKSAIVSGVKKDGELAQLCNISNPRRVYYLRQEVANTSINALARAVTMILDLEMSIKRGADGRDLLVVILDVCRLFQVV